MTYIYLENTYAKYSLSIAKCRPGGPNVVTYLAALSQLVTAGDGWLVTAGLDSGSVNTVVVFVISGNSTYDAFNIDDKACGEQTVLGP